MVEALYNASGLGLPIVMTVANRAIGAPINIWNDHSDSMSQRDSGWIQLYAETNQEALDLHIQAFRLAEELSLPVMVCMDGFILTHAYEQVDIPTQEQVDSFLPPFEPRQVLDPAEPVTIGAMVGPEAFFEVKYLAHAKQMQALDLIPEIAAEFAAPVRPRLRRPDPRLPRRGRRDDRRRPRLGAGHDRGRRRRAARAGPGRSASWESSASGPTRWRRCARRFGTRSGSSCSRRRSRSASAASSARTCGWPSPASSPRSTTVIAGLGGRPITKQSLHGLFADLFAGRLDAGRLTFLDLDRELVERELERMRRAAAPARTPRTSCETSASSPPARTEESWMAEQRRQKIKFYQAGTFVVGNRLLDPEQRSVQARMERSNSLTSGHRACQGCGEALGARYALDAAMRATDDKLIAANATGCLEVFSTPFPESSWQLPWIHSLFGNAPAVATGIAAALKAKGRDRRARHRPGRRRRHRRHRLRLPVGDVRAQRRRALHLLRQRGLHEHGRAALQRDAAGGAHLEHEAARRAARQRLRQGQERAR